METAQNEETLGFLVRIAEDESDTPSQEELALIVLPECRQRC